MRWSPEPKEAYTVLYDGHHVGIGMNPAVDLPGVWNILWLSAPSLDTLLNWQGEPGEFPTDLKGLPGVVGMSFQLFNESSLETIGALALRTTPRQFIAALGGLPEQQRSELIMLRLYGPGWWQIIEERARSWTAGGQRGKVLSADFSKKQQRPPRTPTGRGWFNAK